MPGTFTSISIFAYDLNDYGEPYQVWETVVDGTEIDAINEAKEVAHHHAGVLVVRRDGIPSIGEEGEPIVVFRQGRTDGFD